VARVVSRKVGDYFFLERLVSITVRPIPSKSFPIYQSSYRLILHGLGTDSVVKIVIHEN
jgi:hypothetical protein